MSQGHERSYEPSPLSQTWLLFLPTFSSRNKGAIYSFRDNDITHARAAVFRRLLQYKHLSLLLFSTKFCAVACVSFGFSQLGQKKVVGSFIVLHTSLPWLHFCHQKIEKRKVFFAPKSSFDCRCHATLRLEIGWWCREKNRKLLWRLRSCSSTTAFLLFSEERITFD